MLESFRRIFALLTPGERRAFFILAGLTIVMGITDTIGVAAILPFLAAVGDPAGGRTAWMMEIFGDRLGITDTTTMLQVLGLAVFAVLIASILIKGVTIYLLTRFTKMRILSLSSRLLERYLHQPYEFFLGRNSAHLGKNLLQEVAEVVNGSVAGSVRLMANFTVTLFLTAFLVILEPTAALLAAGFISICFAGVFFVIRKRLLRLGETRVTAKAERFQLAQEAFTGIKNVKTLNLEQSYLSRFRKPTGRLVRAQTTSQLMAQLPRYVLEGSAFGAMILITVWLLERRDGDLSAVLPVLGTFAVAGIRLFPTFQEIFHDTTLLKVTRPALDQLYEEIQDPAPRAAQTRGAPMGLDREIRLASVSYRYPQSELPTVSDIDITIPKNSTVGLFGKTGAGKTTLLDIVLGLIPPTEGALVVDGQRIDGSNVCAWQRSVGYVPQSVYLVDDTIAANIALGADGGVPDPARVEEAARQAALDEFVKTLPDGFDTPVGENGVRLSGGQKQRIGIARALYRDPDVLVFDEATSALDNSTERAVLEAIERLSSQKTILMVAHRLSSMQSCDKIVLIENGRITGEDSYENLARREGATALFGT